MGPQTIYLETTFHFQISNCYLEIKSRRVYFPIAHFQKEWRPRATVGARSIMGLFGGGGARAFLLNFVPPKRSHNCASAHSRPMLPLFLKVGYTVVPFSMPKLSLHTMLRK